VYNNLNSVKRPWNNYIAAVFLSLQQDFVAVAVDFVQQVFPLAHFFDFFLPLSAKAIPDTSNAAVANKNTFFIIIYLINHRKCKADGLNSQRQTVKNYNVAITVTPPCTTWFSSTFIFVPTGNIKSTRLPNFINPISSV